MQIVSQSSKNQVLDAIQALPDNSTFDDIMYRLYVLEKIQKAQQAIEPQEVCDLETMRQAIEQWSSGHNLLEMI